MQARTIDYYAIICLTTQDKNKYNTLKYRYVVKFTSYKNIIVQITSYATKILLVISIGYDPKLLKGLKGARS